MSTPQYFVTRKRLLLEKIMQAVLSEKSFYNQK